MLKKILKFLLQIVYFHCMPSTVDENHVWCTYNLTFVVGKITKIEHFILSIVHLYFQELQRLSTESGTWRAEETLNSRGQTGQEWTNLEGCVQR